ncbi:toll/interleukin-1 receptor domain-containing protein [Spirosoma sordidisoli]|uniref:Toll/interleukin-1 receptor domain-containing protein n=1 Tax=Spirosoma sordidisoli TaxID=2502893 RepID=A0A4Q2UQS6_9BACT|nr:toll/interleukin-1 receptor domain-containing protein [Spirosoma sordidisoli]RYC70025.1 toll/interleukin-1 receptor domain-containing protein [Spirosoma sordidisoli]
MNAFVSYSHQDSAILDSLHKHLAQLKRENVISTWTDRDIVAGGQLDTTISSSLSKSRLFLALLSPDYIASNYCYDREFSTALEMQERGEIIIVPIIVEPCDWHNTPFSQFKALPRDGKAISLWENKNTAFLDVIQNLRKLAQSAGSAQGTDWMTEPATSPPTVPSRNYKVKKDFDSIEKIEFVEKTFQEVANYLKRFIEEIISIENIKARIQTDTATVFESLLVNRNKINTEARLRFATTAEHQNAGYLRSDSGELTYKITTQNNRGADKQFRLSYDDYHLFWMQADYYSRQEGKELSGKEIADQIWAEWLETVGIM